MVLSWLYDVGTRHGSPGFFYYVIAASQLGKLVMLTVYTRSAAGRRSLAEKSE